jgi:hypothetical protein
VQNDHPQAKVLHLSDDLRDVLVGAGDEGVADRTTLSQSHQVAPQLALNSFPAPGKGIEKPQLEAGHLGERIVLGRSAAFCGSLIPVTAQHGKPGTVSREASQQLQQARVIPRDGIPAARAMNGHGAIGEGIACINE